MLRSDYPLDSEPLAGPQRRLRMRLRDVYVRTLTLLEDWSEWLGDSYTRINYEYLADYIGNDESVQLSPAIASLEELLSEFEPDRIEDLDAYDEDAGQRIFCEDPAKRERMEAERDALLKELAECKILLGNQ